MAGVNEDLGDRKTAEAMKKALEILFPGQKFTLRYIPRDNILGYDEHRIVRGGWLRFYFGRGRGIVVRYFGDTLCDVFDEKVQKVLEKQFFKPELHQVS